MHIEVDVGTKAELDCIAVCVVDAGTKVELVCVVVNVVDAELVS